jgi:uncharacterized repeat protein (TIGR01451 family)
LLAALVGGSVSRPAAAARGESQAPIDNPDLEAACGIDIAVILDRSGSIANAGATPAVKAAFKAFTSALKNTGSRLAVADFSTTARLPLPAPATQTYTAVTDATIATIFDPYINAFNPSGSTNWEDGLRMGRYFIPRPSPTTPHLVVFITDGDPNYVIRSTVSQIDYQRKVPLDSSQVQSTDMTTATNQAVPNANAIKGAGSHILVVAVGAGLNNQQSLNRIIAISGPDVFPTNTPTFDIQTTDVYRQPDFSQLEQALRAAAFQLCAPSVNVQKLVDIDPDPVGENLQPGAGWHMTAQVSPAPEWVVPPPPNSSGSTATGTTSADGFVNFQWTTAGPTTSTITVTENLAEQPGFVNDPSATTCTYRTPDAPNDKPLPGFSAANGSFSGTVPDESIVTCRMVNRIPPNPAVDIEKLTNGVDADLPGAPPGSFGPFIPIGDPVTWTYVVTNTGNVPLMGVTVTDNQPGVTPDCGGVTTLDVGASMTCTDTDTVPGAVAGQYSNIGTVNATGAGTAVTDSDPSHYFGVAPGITIVKSTNGDDANDPPGPFVTLPSTVTWTYLVTNSGNVPLTGVTVTDNQSGVTPNCGGVTTLAVGASMTCTASGAAQPGQYENIGLATGITPTGTTVVETDPSHYFGMQPSVSIVKRVNGDDANTAPGVQVPVGSPVTWTYTITNTGNVPLSNWQPTDDQGVLPACARLFALLPGRSTTCFAGGTAQAGQHTNIGSVSATNLLDPDDPPATVTDPANYYGVEAGIAVVKTTNGPGAPPSDANDPPGPFISVGDAVTWTYVVTNTSNVELTNVSLFDLPGGVIACPPDTLAAGASMTCTVTGTAAPGQFVNLAFVRGETPLGDVVRALDPSHYFGATSGIALEKDTNGVDADLAPGPLIPVGGPVDWSYFVTNTGNLPLTGVALTDSKGVAVTCPADTLAAGATMMCTASGTAQLGQYANTGTVTATTTDGATLTDSDPSHYYGVRSAIHIVKLTNGEDANTAPGPSIPVGDRVRWTYNVTNPGNVPILGVKVTDSRGEVPQFTGGDTNGDSRLDPGETWTYGASGPAVAGQYENIATVTGLDVIERPVSDTDPSHYFGTGGSTPPPPSPPPPPEPPPEPPITPIVPGETSTVRVVKMWVGTPGSTTIFVDRNGKAPFDASAVANSNGDRASLVVPVSSPVYVGERPVPRGYAATINCGSGPRPYTGGPFRVTSPARASATRVCTIVNRKLQPLLVIDKAATKKVIRADQTVGFLINVKNRGRGAATNVEVCDRLPDGLVFVRTSPGARFVNGDVCWRIARLPAGAGRSFAVRAKPVRTGAKAVYVNVATLTSPHECKAVALLAAQRAEAVCRARAPVTVLPSKGGVAGVTG